MRYYFSKSMQISFDDAVAKVTAELNKEGFAVLTQIDVCEAQKKKLKESIRGNNPCTTFLSRYPFSWH